LHPATFPISLAKKVISLFTHEGELVIDPFVGSGTTLVAVQDLNRNAVGFDLNQSYVSLCGTRLAHDNAPGPARQIAVQDEASHIPEYIARDTVSLIWTSPPYANLLNRKRKNKSRRGDERKNKQFGKVEQYSQDPRDLGTMPLDDYTRTMGDIFQRLLPLLKPKAHCVINVPDMWWENQHGHNVRVPPRLLASAAVLMYNSNIHRLPGRRASDVRRRRAPRPAKSTGSHHTPKRRGCYAMA
jgi:DNA modification methylase